MFEEEALNVDEVKGGEAAKPAVVGVQADREMDRD